MAAMASSLSSSSSSSSRGKAAGKKAKAKAALLPWHDPRGWLGGAGRVRVLEVPADVKLAPPLTPADVARTWPEGDGGAAGAWEWAGSGKQGGDPRAACDGGAAPPLVVLPGFGNAAEDYGRMLASLRARGFRADVAPLERVRWLEVFRKGVLNPRFWAAELGPETCYGWYLDLAEDALDATLAEHGTAQAALVGHSAGGWLARCVAARRPEAVAAVVTLGSPHFPTPPPGRDMTGGALTTVSERWPGAVPGSGRTICVAGRAVVGALRPEGGEPLARDAPWQEVWRVRAAESYKEVCCEVEVAGDGTVPCHYALLEGAEHVLLDGVFHAMNAPTLWYGSDEVVESWASLLCAPPPPPPRTRKAR